MQHTHGIGMKNKGILGGILGILDMGWDGILDSVTKPWFVCLCRHPLSALFVLRVHFLGFRTAQSVLRQGYRHLAHCLPALWFCLAGGVRCGSGDAQQPKTH